MVLKGKNYGVERTRFFSGGCQGEFLPLTFLVSRGHPHSLTHGPFTPSSKPASVESSFYTASLWPFVVMVPDSLLLSLPFIFKDSCYYVGPTGIIQVNFPSVRSANLTYSQAPEVRIVFLRRRRLFFSLPCSWCSIYIEEKIYMQVEVTVYIYLLVLFFEKV